MLERVLKAISLMFKDLGYCQGMNFVCAVFVMHCNEEVSRLLCIRGFIFSQGRVLDYGQSLNKLQIERALQEPKYSEDGPLHTR